MSHAFSIEVIDYTGDAASNRLIATAQPLDVGVVAILHFSRSALPIAMYRHNDASMTGSAVIGSSGVQTTAGIMGFEAGGFRVTPGTLAGLSLVNAAGILYRAVVIRDTSATNKYLRIGQYNGLGVFGMTMNVVAGQAAVTNGGAAWLPEYDGLTMTDITQGSGDYTFHYLSSTTGSITPVLGGTGYQGSTGGVSMLTHTSDRTITVAALGVVTLTDVFVFGRGGVYRNTTHFPADDCINLDPEARTMDDAILSISANTFVIGASNDVNNSALTYYYMGLAVDSLIGRLFENFKGVGTAATPSAVISVSNNYSVGGLVLARSGVPSPGGSIDSFGSVWKGPTHVGLDSTRTSAFSGSGDVATQGVRAINPLSIELGNLVAPNGNDVYGFAFKDGIIFFDEVTLPSDSGTIGLTWVEFLDSSDTLRVWAAVPLPDPSTYYGGFKESRVTDWGLIQRSLSDRLGQYQGSEFKFTLADTDHVIRSLLSAGTTRFFTNRPVTVRMISDPDRRDLLVPRTVVKGVVRDYAPQEGLSFEFTVRDILAQKFDPNNTTQQIPQRLITLADFPNAPAGDDSADNVGKTFTSTSVPTPSGYQQLSDQAAVRNLQGDISNGVYGPAEVRGWVGYDGSGTQFPAGGWRCPLVSGDVYFATTDVATVLEAASGGKSSIVSVGLPVPIIYGAISDLSITSGIDSGDGQCPQIYVGMYVLSDARTYHKWVLCGHAVKSIDGLYTDNGDTGIGTNPASQIGDLSVQAGIGGDWVVPGYDLWDSLLGPDLFEDINGNRYTTFYGLVGNKLADTAAGFYKPDTSTGHTQTPPLALNMQGIEDIGDGTGDLITDIHAQYLHLLQNWILGNYTSGAWLDSPVFADDPALSQIDEASFSAASAIANDRVSGGYRGDFIIGWTAFDGNSQSSPKFWNVRDLVAAMNMSADVDSGFSRKMQFMVSMEHESIDDLLNGTIVDDVQDIFDQTFSVEDKLTDQFNDYRWFHTEDFFKRSIIGWRFQDTTKDQDSIDGYQEDKIAPDIMFYMIRGFNRASDYPPYEQGTLTAQDVIFRRLRRTKNPPRYASFTMGFSGNNFELGDIILVTHFDGIGPEGWSARPVRIVTLNTNPNDLSVQIVGYDMGELFNTSFILGDRTVLTTWPTETPALQIYGFLGDRVTREFSNGDPIKRLG